MTTQKMQTFSHQSSQKHSLHLKIYHNHTVYTVQWLAINSLSIVVDNYEVVTSCGTLSLQSLNLSVNVFSSLS